MTTRRKFFEVLGFGGAAAALTATGVASATVIARKEAAKEKAIADIQSAGYNSKLTLNATYGERAKQKITNSEYIVTPLTPQFVPGTRKDVTASLTVGPDGEMYLMTNGKWRRIVTE